MHTVLEQYAKHMQRLMYKAVNEERPLTHKERLGISYYRAAASAVEALIDAPTPAWVGAQGKFVQL